MDGNKTLLCPQAPEVLMVPSEPGDNSSNSYGEKVRVAKLLVYNDGRD